MKEKTDDNSKTRGGARKGVGHGDKASQNFAAATKLQVDRPMPEQQAQ